MSSEVSHRINLADHETLIGHEMISLPEKKVKLMSLHEYWKEKK